MPPAIEFENVVKRYQALRPLRVQHLTVAEGERVSITGLDRAAAELFVNLVNGSVLPDQGDVRVFGTPTSAIEDASEWLRSLDRFGVVTERAVLLEGSSLAQNLALPVTLDIDPLPTEVRASVEALAREVMLPAERLDRPVGDAPPAIRLRVHLARALAIAPRVLLLEHPTVVLDAADVPAFATLVRENRSRQAARRRRHLRRPALLRRRRGAGVDAAASDGPAGFEPRMAFMVGTMTPGRRRPAREVW